MSELRVKATDCSSRRLCRIARRAGFVVMEGAKLYKIETRAGAFLTTIPRHSRLKRETVRGIIRVLNEHCATIVVD